MMTAQGARARHEPHGLPQRLRPARSAEQVTTARDLVDPRPRDPGPLPAATTATSRPASSPIAGGDHRNHNQLLGRVEGVDGIKTGYTRAVRLQPDDLRQDRRPPHRRRRARRPLRPRRATSMMADLDRRQPARAYAGARTRSRRSARALARPRPPSRRCPTPDAVDRSRVETTGAEGRRAGGRRPPTTAGRRLRPAASPSPSVIDRRAPPAPVRRLRRRRAAPRRPPRGMRWSVGAQPTRTGARDQGRQARAPSTLKSDAKPEPKAEVRAEPRPVPNRRPSAAG